MRICIDISPIIYGTGVSVYTENLVKNLLRVDPENKYILFGGSLRRRSEIDAFLSTLQGATFKGRVLPLPPSLADLLWNRLHIMPIEWFTGSIDVFHSSDWTQPPSSAFKVTTIHDLSPLKFPKFTDPKVRSTHERRLKLVAKEIDRVIVPSRSTKNDLVELGFEENIIRVIYEAPREAFRAKGKGEIETLKKKFNIADKYLVSVGVGGRKNTDNLIKAFELAKAGKSLTLVLAGRPQDEPQEARGIRYVGHVDEDELSVLYSGAEALVYPSLYEGFGLPILEAMACGCPVVTSNISSMPEVAGDAAVLVDPYSVDSIMEGIKEALKNKKELIKKGKKRAKEFSWEKTARETLEVYKESKT